MALTAADFNAQIQNFKHDDPAVISVIASILSYLLETQNNPATAKISVVTTTTTALAANTATAVTLTANSNGALGAVGGASVAVGDSILVKDEATRANNGIYVVASIGSASSPWILSRRGDAVSPNLVSGANIFAQLGSNGGSFFTLTTPDPITVGTTAQTWAQLSNGTDPAYSPVAPTRWPGLVTPTVVSTALNQLANKVVASVLDYGAVGNAKLGNGSMNPSPTNDAAAFQAAIDANYGKRLFIPAGNYYIKGTVSGKAAINVTDVITLDFDHNAVLYWDGLANTDCVLIEHTSIAVPNASQITTVQNIVIRPYGFSHLGRNGVVIHAPHVHLINPMITDCTGWCILVESGNVELLDGATVLPTGTYIDSNFWRIIGGIVADGGDQTWPGDTALGGGFRVHGSDVNGGSCVEMFATYCNVGFWDSALSGGRYTSCYTEFCGAGYADSSSSGAVFDRCGTEDLHPAQMQANSLIIASPILNQWRSKRVNTLSNESKLVFKERVNLTPNADTQDFVVQMPNAAYDAAMIWYRQFVTGGVPGADSGEWGLVTGGDWSSTKLDKTWVVYEVASPVSPGTPPDPTGHVDANGAPFGWTDGDHPRGPGLFFVARPMFNTQKRWTWRQAGVSLSSGTNYIKTAADYASSFTMMRGEDKLPGADIRVTASVQFPTTDDWTTSLGTTAANAQIATRLTDLQSKPVVYVGGTEVLFQDNTKGAWAVQIINSGSPVTVDIVWHFEFFQRTGSASTSP